MTPSPLTQVTRQKAVWGPRRHKAVWGPKRALALAAILSISLVGSAAAEGNHDRHPAQQDKFGVAQAFVARPKLDRELSDKVRSPIRKELVSAVVMLAGNTDLPPQFKKFARGGKLNIINAYILSDVPVGLLSSIAANATVHRMYANRATQKHDALSSAAVYANAVDAKNNISQQFYGFTGGGVTVAFIDSGFTGYPSADLLNSRVRFIDIMNGERESSAPHDENGHGTHVAGIVGGTGALSGQKYAGIAPGANILSLKVLDENGSGTIADILRAYDWIYMHPEAKVRVVNMSVGASVTESYWTDPLTLATKVLVDRGITVVAAAGNNGLVSSGPNAGQPQYGGVTAPGNAPWVLTVCAFSTKGTYATGDDAVAGFSSAGPTAIDYSAKPDVCAPGVGIVSMSAPGSNLYHAGLVATPSWLISGTVSTGYKPYESLTGTSMATPFVSGAVALMLQANPSLTPNLIKAILEFTAHVQPGVSPLKQGAGFMDVSGALSLANFYAGIPQTVITNASYPSSPSVTVSSTTTHSGTAKKKLAMNPAWSKSFIWGNHKLSGGVINPKANAWKLGVEWGWAKTKATDGDNIVWGTADGGDDNIVWGTASGGDDNIVWGTADGGDDNIVWGTDCKGADCVNVVWGSLSADDNIVWGTASADDNIVWGTASADDNIVWGTADGGDDNIVWGTASSDDNIVWGTSAHTNVVWPINGGGGNSHGKDALPP